MKTLFERVFNGSDEMFAKAEEEVNKIVAEVGRDAPLTLPSTAYFCACIYAYIGKKVTTTGELQDALADVRRAENDVERLFSFLRLIRGQCRCADLRLAASALCHDERRLSLRELALDRFRNRKLRRVKAVARVFADMVVDA